MKLFFSDSQVNSGTVLELPLWQVYQTGNMNYFLLLRIKKCLNELI